MLRGLVIGQLGHFDDGDTVKEARMRFEKHCSGSCLLPANLKAAVFSTCLSHGDGTTFNQLLKVHQHLVLCILFLINKGGSKIIADLVSLHSIPGPFYFSLLAP